MGATNGAYTAETVNNDRLDNRDNGLNTPNPTIDYGIRSHAFPLSFFAEPANEASANLSGNAADHGPQFIGRYSEKNFNSNMTIDFGVVRYMSIGNRVWLDDGAAGGVGNDGILNGGEAGIGDVQISLYRFIGSDPTTPFDASDTANFVLMDDTQTDAQGFYLFDGLLPGEYVVWVEPTNFQSGGALVNYDSSYDGDGLRLPIVNTPATQGETTDKGIDEELPAFRGVASRVVTLEYDAQPTTAAEDENNLSTDTATYGPNARGTNNEADRNSNLYVDFGFHAPPYSIGNFVWYDYNNNGIFDGDDEPVAGVVVRLYNSTGNNADGSGIRATAITSPLQITTTDADGYYIFDNLPAGDYVVWIDAINFREGEPLFEFYSSTGAYNDATTPFNPADGASAANSRDDTRDNGVDNINPVVNGIYSTTIQLRKNQAPMGEDGDDLPDDTPENQTAYGPDLRGRQNQLDSNSDLTRDFGFYKPMSLGNRVWFDVNGDGLISVGEGGIAGVQLQLWQYIGTGTPPDTFDLSSPGDYVPVFQRDANGAPTVPYVVTTDANGYYLFSNLTPGTYQVVIPGGQPALTGLSSTIDDVNVVSPADRNRIDNNDNGIGTNPATDPIFSGPVTLILDSEPTNESDIGPQGIGTNGETNRNSNLTIDFGFNGQLMSLGNRVWFDPNNNGLIDASEQGINGVLVSLYRDNNNDGIPDGPAVTTTTTADGGYYLFDNLSPGLYIVGLNNSNFTAGQPLNGLISSTGVYDDPVTTDIDGNFFREDNRDNGRDVRNIVYGLLSSTITLTLDQAPENEQAADIAVISGVPQIGAGGSNINSDLTRDFGLYRPMSIGNRVWYDLNDNGVQDAGEAGIPGVEVELYLYTGTGDTEDLANYVSVGTTTTDANGYYLFDGLAEGDYIVLVTPQNFQSTEILDGLNSSTFTDSTTTVDRNDNGINNSDPTTDNPAIGVRSNVIPLRVNSSPTGETDLSGNTAAHGPNSRGRNGETDNNSNLTIDFGFVPPSMSIGNRVWIDEGTGANYRNGIIDGDESGVDGVLVRLYFANADGTPIGAPITTTTTTGGGYYLFDGLTPGNYVVQLAPSNFTGTGVLRGYGSTITTANGTPPFGTDADDNRNNGLQGSSPEVNGVFSGLVTLGLGQAPIGEQPEDIGPQGPGAGGVDNNSNLTIDFGVFRPLSIGNRVWFDNGGGALTNNGLQDTGEPGIADVLLELWIANPDGTPGTPFQVLDASNTLVPYTTTTDNGGYYIFDGLPPGSYVVLVSASNFTATGALVGLTNSEPIRPDILTGETNVDRNNNGVDEADPQANGMQSNVITLTLGTQPTNETDLSGNALAHGPNFRGRNGEANNNSNLTIDFGFFPADGDFMSIGNRVWLDDGTGAGGIYNDGRINGEEVGIAGVTVQLFQSDAGGNPIGGALAQTVTDAEGYYLFDNLAPGRYVVIIPAVNFNTPTAPLYGLLSSTGAYTADNNGNPVRDDERDNGIDTLNPGTNGIRSGVIQLVLDNAPLGEADIEPGGNIGANGDDTNSNITIDFGFVPQFDWGDAPDTGAIFTFPNGNAANYGTTEATNGPRHRIVPDLYIGSIVDAEPNGQPTVGADGDDNNPASVDDEDGVFFPPLVADAPVNVEVFVFNNTGRNATLVGWIDFNGNGTFDPSEAVSVVVPSSPLTQTVYLPFYVPQGADFPQNTDGTTYARFRLTTDDDIFDTNGDPLPTGLVNDGEIEDYRVTILQPGIAIDKTNGQNSIVVGQETTYTVTIRNSASGVPVTNRLFQDDLPPEFLPETVSWTCTANGFASCISGQLAGTNLAGDGNPLLNLDLEPRGEIIIRIRATLDPALIPTSPNQTVTNVANFLPDQAIDVSGIIFDPPGGIKTGVVEEGNIIRWTMDWRNTGEREFATVSDVLQPNQTFAGNLICTPFGDSTTSTCTYNPATRTVSWTGFIGTGFANRVLITFDVVVPGPGEYVNTATISRGGETRNAVGTVTIPGDPSPFRLDPAIVKLVDPIFAQPGESVTWTIELINPHDSPLTNVSFTDTMPSQFTIIATDASAGSVTVNGQQIEFFIETLPAQQTITVRVLTQVRLDVVPPFVATNLATLNDPYRGEASATVTGVSELPATGETPLWSDWLRYWLRTFSFFGQN